MKIAWAIAFMVWCIVAAFWIGEVIAYVIPEKKFKAVPYTALLLCLFFAGCDSPFSPQTPQQSKATGTVRINLCVYYFPATDTVCP